MAYRIAAIIMTLSDLDDYSLIASFLKCIFVQLCSWLQDVG